MSDEFNLQINVGSSKRKLTLVDYPGQNYTELMVLQTITCLGLLKAGFVRAASQGFDGEDVGEMKAALAAFGLNLDQLLVGVEAPKAPARKGP